MISIVYTDSFLKSSGKLPKEQQNKLSKLLEILQHNPFHSKLRTKSLTGPLAGFYSFRITRDWRAIFHFLNPDKIKLIGIGHRKDIYR
ncbi:MAG: type II toxin-antitoxin system mRNA interferase toxin, RelE/StbE family [Candidatus Nealsonbacteria bacterium]|nr:type II toxin-antitoxin system mRNA interferase toxin, RelE/StbE family [Candidatus Nealsonbacteria bacterium]